MRPSLHAYARYGIAYVKPKETLRTHAQAYLDALGPECVYDRAERASNVPLPLLPTVLARLRARFVVLEYASLQTLLIDSERLRASLKTRTAARLKALGPRLYPYQREGAAWLTERAAALLADEMGLGKTVQALAALPEGRSLVVCPAIAIGTWEREIPRWRPDLRPLVLSKKTFAVPKPPFVGIVSYDSLPFDVAPWPDTTLIADEAHAIKSPQALRTRSFRLLASRVLLRGGRVWLMTGSPIENKPQELWHLLHSAGLAYKVFGSWDRFVELFGGMPAGPRGEWEEKDGKRVFIESADGEKGKHGYKWTMASPEVRRLLAPVMLRRKRREVLPDLPTKRYALLDASLEKTEMVALDRSMGLLRDDESAEVLYQRLSRPAEFSAISGILERLSTAKIPSLLKQIDAFEEAGEPVVVFSPHRRPIEVLRKRKGWLTILGEDPPDVRARAVAEFQAGNALGIAGTIGAMGTSVTLTRAASVLFVGRAWNPMVNAQAEDRVCRIGQTRGVMIYDLTSPHPLDMRIVAVLAEKTRLIESVL